MKQTLHNTTGNRLKAAALIALAVLCCGRAAAQVTVGGSVYGGGALANVNGSAQVDILGGTVEGSVYGGGLGQKNGVGGATEDIAALVTGNATVNIGASTETTPIYSTGGVEYYNNVVIGGYVFGANNLNGTPQGDVQVNIYHTKHTASNMVPGITTVAELAALRPAESAWASEGAAADDAQFALKGVYGGGNLAHYVPTNSTKMAQVNVYGCENTIDFVYGGGKAADGYHTEVNIHGGHIDTVFAGGDGSEPGTEANLLGNVEANITGGMIGAAFGGSNTRGNISGTMAMNINNDGGCIMLILGSVFGGGNLAPTYRDADLTINCPSAGIDMPHVGEIYGGGNKADVNGNVRLTIAGGTYDDVFGGNNQTGTITGNVELILKGGTMTNAFGGNNAGGDILGSILVSVVDDESQHCPLRITNVFGGGNEAAYSPTDATIASPQVNIRHMRDYGGTANSIQGNVFGGGLGTTATVTANPVVTIGALSGDSIATVDGNVYGGGSMASVVGNTSVNIRKSNTVVGGNVFGAGMGVETTGSDDHLVARVSGNTAVSMTDGTVKGNIYGGGEMASVGVFTYSADGKAVTGRTSGGYTSVAVSGGTVGVEELDYTKVGNATQVEAGTHTREFGHSVGYKGHVFGGGLGKAGDDWAAYAFVDSTRVEVGGGYIVGSVFGGGECGHVQHNSGVHMTAGTVGQLLNYKERKIDPVTGSPAHHIHTGNIYGGGRGIETDGAGHFTATEGRVYGNTYAVVSGGQVRHAVYGGGSLASVGTYNLDTLNLTEYEANPSTVKPDIKHYYLNGTGDAHVTISGTAWIGHSGADLEDHATDERAEYFLGAGKKAIDLIEENYRYLGSICGMVYGSGRGVSSLEDDELGTEYAEAAFTNNTYVTIDGTAMVCGSVFGGGENGHVKQNTDVKIKGGTIGGIPMHNNGFQTKDEGFYPGVGTGTGDGHTLNHIYEDLEDESGVGPAVYRGNVYGGGRGVDHFGASGVASGFSTSAGRVYGNTNVEVSGGTVYQHVFGGGSIASVGTYDTAANGAPTEAQHIFYYTTLKDRVTASNRYTDTVDYPTGLSTVTIRGGQIGSMGWNEGSVFGGGRGIAGEKTWQVVHLAYVDRSVVNIQPGAQVMGSVFGGGANGHVLDSTFVHITGGIVGHPFEEADTLTTIYGYAPRTVFRGNVYGGGRGVDPLGPHKLSRTAGRVYGNTHVLMTGGWVRHSLFGGGSMASVGDYDTATAAGTYDGFTLKVGDVIGLKSGRDENLSGRAWVEITGGIVGSQAEGVIYIDGGDYSTEMKTGQGGEGRDNGRVFGSCRGTAGEGYDHLAYVNITRVIIGKNSDHTGPQIMGCVFGSGENGHVLDSTLVQMHGGQIGRGKVYDWKRTYIGNLYGGGRGVDLDHNNTLSSTAGWVRNSTHVEMTGGRVWHNVYGGGSLASVGPLVTPGYSPFYTIDSTKGRTWVEITGGKVGRDGLYGGNVFGSGRGRAGENIDTVFHLCSSECTYVPDVANATTENVTIGTSSYGIRTLMKKSNPAEDSLYLAVIRSKVSPYPDSIYYVLSAKTDNSVVTTSHDFSERTNIHNAKVIIDYAAGNSDTSLHRICGSVYGSGDNGHVLNTTHVAVKGGTIGNRFLNFDAAARTAYLAKYPVADRAEISANIASNGMVLTAGSVYGSGRGLDLTNVGNHMSPTAGRVYGHTVVDVTGGHVMRNVYGGGNMAGVGDGTRNASDELVSSHATAGTTTVTVGGSAVIGETYAIVSANTLSGNMRGQYGGNVFGSSRGLSADNTLVKNMAFVRETHVTINNGTVYGSVFGGGENGHVWHNTYVTINDGTIGYAEVASIAEPVYPGNVYGGGRGIDLTDASHVSRTSGAVYGNTHVVVRGGTVYHNVFGGGSLASVGRYIFNDGSIPTSPVDSVLRVATISEITGSGITPGIDSSWGKSYVTILGGTIGTNGSNNGRVFGAGRGIAGQDGTGNAFNYYTFVDQTLVVIDSMAQVNGCVFGSGDNGHVSGNTVVYVRQTHGKTDGHPFIGNGNGGPVNGNVFGSGRGADRGYSTADSYANPFWYSATAGRVRGNTQVNITGGTIKNNVYGGGFMASVLGNTEVNIGTEAGGPSDFAIWGDVFGGSALGTIGSDGNTTTVNILSGTIGSASEGYNAGKKGNIFGGGNGDAGAGNALEAVTVYVDGDPSATVSSRAADVKNTVNVVIGATTQQGDAAKGATINGMVFGGNNIDGCPKGNINVDVYSTAHNATNAYPTSAISAATPNNVLDKADIEALGYADNTFALAAVFGGGNKAAYSPDGSNKTTVTIYGCSENTVKYVYGGGRAADSRETELVIEGGRIYQVYAGGDGSGSSNPGANITNNAAVTIKGGLIDAVFGGSNTKGVVQGVASVSFDESSSCDLVVAETFGGGNMAPGGSAVVTIPCGITGLTDVYGGAKAADIGAPDDRKDIILTIEGGDMQRVFGGNKAGGTIYGNVTVKVYGSNPDHTIDEVFGGSNEGGNIIGDILVRVNDSVPQCPLNVNTVYGGGNIVAYEPDGTSTVSASRFSPKVELINGTVNQDVFGGGFGEEAVIWGNPQVLVGSDGTNTNTSSNHTFTVLGNIYGGGSASPVKGSTLVKLTSSADHAVTIGTSDDAVNILGGYPTENGNIFGGGLGATATVDGNTSVGIFGNRTNVYHNVYGGGSAGIVYGTTDVQVGTEAAFTMALPNIAVGPDGMVTLASTTPGASFRYNISDTPTDPTTESGTAYSAPFQATAGQVIKAIAYRDDYTPSAVATSAAVPIPVPTVSSNGTIATATANTTYGPADQTIYYTLDGSTPDPDNADGADDATKTYTSGVTVSNGNVMKVIATKSGYTQSSVYYTTVATPVVTIEGGNATITCATPNATIRYVLGTEDSENPGHYLAPDAPTAWTTTGSTTYSGTPVAIAEGQTIKVIADLAGYAPSAVTTKTRSVTP